jgi:hypothetical protein
MKKIILFLEGFVEGFVQGWNGASAKPAENPQLPKVVAARFDASPHLTPEDLETVFALLAKPPYTVASNKPAEQASPTMGTHRVADVLDADELADVLRLLAEAPTTPASVIADVAEPENTPSIPVFYFPEVEETAIEEIDPAYGAWVEMAQQGYCC